MLVVAPTGSGKTLAAFLAALDRLASVPPPAEARKRCRVLYVSPLKALAVDVERNLRSPLTGIRQESVRLGRPEPDIRVGIRSGDTPPAERRAMATRPPDILITTPESLFLMLTSSARDALAGVETVILDEVHAVAGTKRGAHLALSLERLDELLPRPARRIGLSATVRPVDEVARYLSPQRRVEIVQPPSGKEFDLSVVVPVQDLGELGGSPAADSGGTGDGDRPSIWPHVEERIADLVQAHRSTIVFANSRRLAERLCNRLNEIAYERATGEAMPEAHSPAEIMAESGAAKGAPPLLARAHHGSVSKEQRARVEEDLKAGGCPPSSPRPAWSWASTWARWISSSRSSRRRRWPPTSSVSAGRATRSARSPRASSSPSTGAIWCRPPSSPSGCARAPSRPCGSRPTRWTSWPSSSSPRSRSTPGRRTTCSLSRAARRPSRRSPSPRSPPSSTCSRAAIRPTPSPSCAPGWCGTG